MRLVGSKTALKYIFLELLPGFMMGAIVFIFILLMFQVLRLIEFVIVHGGDLHTTFKIVVFLTVSFLPAVLPMSLLFAVLLSFTRLSGDSEIVALKSSGLHMGHLLIAPIILGVLVAAVSAHISFFSAPWGNRQFEVIVTQLGQTKAVAAIREGVFSEGFFDLVVYAEEVDSKEGLLKNVFIYDDREENNPVTIIAQDGQLMQSRTDESFGATLRLINGNIHRTSEDSYTKVNFKTYDINLLKPIVEAFSEKSLLSLTHPELIERIEDPNTPRDKRLVYLTEYHKRWAISIACILFAALGVGLGTTTNRRTGKSSSLVLSLGVIITYWILYMIGENLSKTGSVPSWMAIWFANFFFTILSIVFLRKAWN